METKEIILWGFLSISLIINIMYLLSTYKENYKKTYEDPLTKLRNRKFLDEIKKMVHISDDKFDVIFCDIDFFKKVNDTYGHDTGDKVLEITGQKLKSSFKSSKDFVLRFGGEEFLIFLLKEKDNKNHEDNIYRRIEGLRKSVEGTTLHIGESDIKFTMSFGISFYKDDLDLDQQIKLSDEALYKSKETGRNKITIAE